MKVGRGDPARLSCSDADDWHPRVASYPAACSRRIWVELVTRQARHDPVPSDGTPAGSAPLWRPTPSAHQRLSHRRPEASLQRLSRRTVVRLTWAAATLPLLAACT